MSRYYKVMLGERSKYADECFTGSFIGVWYDIEEDLNKSLSDTKEAFEMIYIPLLEEKNRGKSSCNKLWKFYREIEIGDIVLCPDGDPYDSFYIGEITSDYYFKLVNYKNGEKQPHRRKVKWFEYKIKKEELSDELKTTIKQPVTIIDLTHNFSNEIKLLLEKKNEKKINTPKDNGINFQKYVELIRRYIDQSVIGLLLSQFLENTLQSISNDWWQELVVKKLSDIQLKTVKRKKINTLDRLDNAALLNILIQNLNEISNIEYLLEEDKNTIYLMKNIRNRIEGHFTNKAYDNLFDILRDFDSILRFLKLINIEQEDIQKIIDEIKNIILEIMRYILQDEQKNS